MVSLVTKNTPGVHHFLVSNESAGQRIDNFLFTYLKGVPKTRVYRIVRKGEVRVNKGRVKPDYRLNDGDSIRIPPVRQAEPSEVPYIPEHVEQNLLNHILYEDDDLILLNKPSGIAVHGGSGLSFGVIEAFRILRPEVKSLELVHRLDRDTSGCLLISKRRSALLYLHDQLKAGNLLKQYITLVKGDWQKDSVIDVPLKKNQLSSGERIVRVHFDEGKPSRTAFRVLSQWKLATLMEVDLITGRTHQIRVHCQYAGHEVAGDPKYGNEAFNRFMKTKGLSRLFLHANRITFNLPKTGERLSIEAPLDNALTLVLKEFT